MATTQPATITATTTTTTKLEIMIATLKYQSIGAKKVQYNYIKQMDRHFLCQWFLAVKRALFVNELVPGN